MINLLLFLIVTINVVKPPHVGLIILLNNLPFDSENESVSSKDTIYLKLTSPKLGTKYKFESVKIQWLLKETRAGKEAPAIKTPKGPIYLAGSSSKWVDLKEFEVIYPTSYQRACILKIPFNNFYDKCLSRVLIKIDKISYQKGAVIGTLSSNEFDYTKEYEFWPDWDCH